MPIKADRSGTSKRSGPGNRAQQLRSIPSLESILSSVDMVSLIGFHGRDQVKTATREELSQMRVSESAGLFSMVELVHAVSSRLEESDRAPLRRVVNATGVIIHTNLGRSPIDPSLWSDAGKSVAGYSDLELDLESGERGQRDERIEGLARRLFGCESAILVNNNAGATLLLLAAVARNREVIVSRGELVEIGGSFRIPEVIEQGGAILREVGATNRTRRSDYIRAAGPSSAAILRVSRSNFEMVGFTEQPSIDDLVTAGRETGLPVLFDEGSGRVVDLGQYGFRSTPTLREILASGIDAVTCSTDKLLGATQGGLILGRREIIERCRRHPLMRALRAGKESYAIIGETLRAFLRGAHETQIPVYRMLATTLDILRVRAVALAEGVATRVIETRSVLGGGTTPSESIPSLGFALDGDAVALHRDLLANDPPILGRVQDDSLILDLRTVFPEEDRIVSEALRRIG